MKQLYILLFLLVSTLSYSQIEFENGYFINNSNKKIECLIKILDWDNNPHEFYYKISINTKPILGKIENIKEFGIYNKVKYIRKSVLIDKSSNKIDDISNLKKPSFYRETLYLKSIVESEISLYEYKQPAFSRYFFSKEDNFKQLIYKKYYNNNGALKENNNFRQQLYNILTCKSITEKRIKKTRYIKNDLKNIFIDYNKCKQQKIKIFDTPYKKIVFNSYLKIGGKISSIRINDLYYNGLENNLNYRFGIELEAILPFNNNKWSVFIDPSIQKNDQKGNNNSIRLGHPLETKVAVNYTSLDIPFGVKKYFYINNDSKLFFDIATVISVPLEGKINFIEKTTYSEVEHQLSLNTAYNFSIGIGYTYKKFSFKVLHQTKRDLVEKSLFFVFLDKSYSAILGYKIF